MAYNPFHAFRRHQKVIFAVMAIVCMVLFVLSSGVGGGDILNQITDWAGRRGGSSKDAIATLDGKNIDGQTLEITKRNRKLADRFVSMCVNAAHGQILAAVVSQLNTLDPVLQRTMQEYFFLIERGGQLSPSQFFSMMGNIQSRLIQHRAIIEQGTAANKKDQIALIQNMILVIDRQRARFERAMLSPRDSYFGGDPDKLEDNLDYLIWKDEAAKLGIQFSKDNVASTMGLEMLNQPIRTEQSKQIEMALRQEFGDFYSPERLNEALDAEFRVRAAKSAIGGEHGTTRTALPVDPTPDELFDWYRDVRTMVRVGLIEVPVASMLAKVTETPTEAQLKELYDRHKNDEFDPRLERPGFKDPRKVKVDWFAAPSDAGFYKQAAEVAAGPLFQALRQFGSSGLAGADGSPLATFGAIMGLHPAVANARKSFHYLDYLNSAPSWFDPYGFGRRSGTHDSSVIHAESIATLIGSTIGGLATGSGPFSGPLAFESRVVAREVRDRARLGASILLAGLLDPAPLGIDALALQLVPQPPTEKDLENDLRTRELESLTAYLLRSDLQKFREELAKRAKEQDQNNVQAYINEFLHARQFQRGGTADAVDRWALPTDPGVQPLRVAFDKTNRRRDDPLGEQFARQLAENGPGNQFMPLPPQNFSTEQIDADRDVYVHWRSEDRPPKVVAFDQARPRVEHAWRFKKARELAVKEADRLAAEAKTLSGDVQKLRDLAVQASSRGLIELDPMAVWNSQISFTSASGPRYDPPTIPERKVSYPGTMATDLVHLRKDEVGSSIVVSDQPKANFFVATLLGKDVPTIDAFRMSYKGWQAPPMVRDSLFEIFIGERQRQFRTDLMKQLRADHKLEIKKGAESAES